MDTPLRIGTYELGSRLIVGTVGVENNGSTTLTASQTGNYVPPGSPNLTQ